MTKSEIANSVVFSAIRIDRINESVKVNIDPRLYFAAYYSPKPLSDASWEYNFWCAITNLYGLFKDCSAYTFQYKDYALLNILSANLLLKPNEKATYLDLVNLICSTRSIFCHNSSAEHSKASSQYNDLCELLMQFDIPYADKLPYKVSLDDSQWEKMTKHICLRAEQSMSILMNSLELLKSYGNKDVVVCSWIQSLSIWYAQNKEWTYQALEERYRMLMTMSRATSHANDRVKKSCINNWQKHMDYKQATMEHNNTITSSADPALPLQVINTYLDKCQLTL